MIFYEHGVGKPLLDNNESYKIPAHKPLTFFMCPPFYFPKLIIITFYSSAVCACSKSYMS